MLVEMPHMSIRGAINTERLNPRVQGYLGTAVAFG